MKRLSLAVVFVLSACAQKDIQYDLQIVTQGCDAAANPFDGAKFVRVRVLGDSLTTLDSISESASKKLSIPAIPVGTNRVIEVRAYDADPLGSGKLLSMGSSLPFDVPEVVPTELDGKPVSVSVTLRKINSLSPTYDSSSPTGCERMNVARAGHSATLLKNGKVFIAGGYNYKLGTTEKVALADAEIFDPSRGSFTVAKELSFSTSSSSGKQERAFHTATLIPSSGQVAIWGGEVYQGPTSIPSPRASFLFYDPDLNGYTSLAPRSPPAIPRSHHAAAIDLNGKILIVGGVRNSTGELVTEVEWVDPSTGLYKIIDGLEFPRIGMGVSPIKGGEYIAVAGGTDGGTVVDDVSFFKYTGASYVKQAVSNPPAKLAAPGRRAAGVATIRDGGEILLLGGYSDPATLKPMASSEIVNAQTAVVAQGPDIGSRGDVCAVTLANGLVMAIGGRTADIVGGPSHSEATIQLIKTEANGTLTVTSGPVLPTGRYGHTCTALRDGTVLITGGISESVSGGLPEILKDAYIYQPAPNE